MPFTPLFNALRGGVIVSVQAEVGEPLYPTPMLAALCGSALQGGAVGLRVANPALMKQLVATHPTLPVIGLHKPEPLPKQPKSSVYITATFADALALCGTGVGMIALDATARPRPDGLSLAQTISGLRQAYPQTAIMADIDSLESARYAFDAGVDCLSTTLSGYTLESEGNAATLASQPDFDLLAAMAEAFPSTPLFLEGRVWEPWQVAKAFELGASSVVIGSAITRPQHITARFKAACP